MRLVNGENAVNVHREHRGMTQAQLAAVAQISQVYVSRIESGSREGRIDVLNRIAKALDVPLETFTD